MLTVRDIKESDIDAVIAYWYNATPAYLESLGADPAKMPGQEQFRAGLAAQIALPYSQKCGYALLWEKEGLPIGHCNVNPLLYGDHAFMHIHIWDKANRQKGLGLDFIKLSVPYFFKNLQLKKLCCEPYALNAAPNKTLAKAGFTFVKEYITTPGMITFEQPVNLWEIYLDS